MTSRTGAEILTSPRGARSKEAGSWLLRNKKPVLVGAIFVFLLVPFLIFNYQIGFLNRGGSGPHKELHVKGEHSHKGTRESLLRRKFAPSKPIVAQLPHLDEQEGVSLEEKRTPPPKAQPPSKGEPLVPPPLPTTPVSPNKPSSAVVKSNSVGDDPTNVGAQAVPDRQAAVKGAMKYAWDAYAEKCFGSDEFHPVSRSCSDWVGMGLTIVDALDTLYVMDMKEEFQRGRDWVAANLNVRPTRTVSFFETVIRMLGGLLSAYEYSNDAAFLDKARALGDALLPAFDTPTGLPRGQVQLSSGQASNAGWTGDSTLLAEVGTVQLEFFYLSAKTGDMKYAQRAQRVVDHVDKLKKPLPGLYPIFLSVTRGDFTPSKISLGAMGDSFYEYLLKMWILTGKKHEQYRRMYEESTVGIMNHLLQKSPNGLWYVADIENDRKEHKMDELACFTGGMLALGVASGAIKNETDRARQLQAAEDLSETCYQMFASQPTGIAGEYYTFRPNLALGEGRYHLRPETVESLFILWRVTHKQKYRDWAWQIFQAIEAKCKVATGGYTGLSSVTSGDKQDKQESFFLAETLKYLYLTFSDDDALALDGATAKVFNTECHPLGIIDLNIGALMADGPPKPVIPPHHESPHSSPGRSFVHHKKRN